MANIYQEPIYNLKSVVQETGVKPDTLRAWERRYGHPNPSRTQGGHRAYSQWDIDIIKWLLARQREGLRIQRAVELWHNLERSQQEPLQPAPLPQAAAVSGGAVEELQRAWTSACLDFDERRSERILTQAFALYPPEKVCLDVLRNGIARIGQEWYAGRASVQQEHFATALAMRRIEALLLAAPPPTRPGRILAACPSEEGHSFGLLLLTYLLRREGWDVLYLGANVPIERLLGVIKTANPSLVISAALQLTTAATLMEMAQFLQQEEVDLAFGGRIFDRLPGLRSRVPGHFLGESLEQAPRVVDRLMSALRPVPPYDPTPEASLQALVHYREHRLLIEADLTTQFPDALGEAWFQRANRELARDIMAALALGDIHYLDDNMEWLEGMGAGQHVPTEVLDSYLRAYTQAAVAHLDERGAPVLNWLTDRASADRG